MKKILFLLCLIVLSAACALDEDNNQQFHVEFIPVESVDLPQNMSPGHEYEVTVNFRRPNDCYYFDGFYYQASDHIRTVAVQALYIEDANCSPITSELPDSESFILKCPENYAFDTYLFKFYQGEDAAGNQIYLEREVPITY
jgi:hypothetical protein